MRRHVFPTALTRLAPCSRKSKGGSKKRQKGTRSKIAVDRCFREFSSFPSPLTSLTSVFAAKWKSQSGVQGGNTYPSPTTTHLIDCMTLRENSWETDCPTWECKLFCMPYPYQFLLCYWDGDRFPGRDRGSWGDSQEKKTKDRGLMGI